MPVLGWPAKVPVQGSRDSAPYFVVSIRSDCAALCVVSPVSSGVMGAVRICRAGHDLRHTYASVAASASHEIVGSARTQGLRKKNRERRGE